MASADFPYRWAWRARLPDRHGQRLRVLAWGALNSCQVAFEDGWRVIASRNALRHASASDGLDRALDSALDAAPRAADVPVGSR